MRRSLSFGGKLQDSLSLTFRLESLKDRARPDRMTPARASKRRGIVNTTFALIFLAGILCSQSGFGAPQQLGDLKNDGEINVLDLVILINHINGSANLDPQFRGYADVNGDGYINQAD